MYKKHKSIYIILFLTIFLCLNITNKVQSISYVFKNPNGEANLVADSLNFNNIPSNFRKTSDLSTLEKDTTLNTKGMDKLNMSGSAQFGTTNLPLLTNNINTKLPITVVDLRQESHGFINQYAVSWANSKNNANMGLTRDEVIAKENSDLSSIKLNSPLTFYNHPKISVVPTKVQNEQTLTKSNKLSYVRIPVTDNKLPTDEMVDYFVQFVKSQPKNSWLHFHCKHGIGRTSVFMIMYDIMRNNSDVSLDDIMKRQLTLANFKESTVERFYKPERLNFLTNFYNYCKQNGNDFNIKWSDFKKSSPNSVAK